MRKKSKRSFKRSDDKRSDDKRSDDKRSDYKRNKRRTYKQSGRGIDLAYLQQVVQLRKKASNLTNISAKKAAQVKERFSY